MENAPTLAQPGSTSSATRLPLWRKSEHRSTLSSLTIFSIPSGSFQYTSFRLGLNWNALRTQTKYSKYGKYGYRNAAQVTLILLQMAAVIWLPLR